MSASPILPEPLNRTSIPRGRDSRVSRAPRIVAAVVPLLLLAATMPMPASGHHVSGLGEPTESYGYIGYGVGDHTIDCGGAGNRVLDTASLPGVSTVRYEDGCVGGVISSHYSDTPPPIQEHWTVWAVDGTYEGLRRATWSDVDIVPPMFARMIITAGTGDFSEECMVSDPDQPDPPADVCNGERPQGMYSKVLTQFSVCGKGSVTGIDTTAWEDVQDMAAMDAEALDWYQITFTVFVDGPKYAYIDCGTGADLVTGVYDDAACWVNDRGTEGGSWAAQDCGTFDGMPSTGVSPCSKDTLTSTPVGPTCIQRFGAGASHCWSTGSGDEAPYNEDHTADIGTTGRIYWDLHSTPSGCLEPTGEGAWIRSTEAQQSEVWVNSPVPVPGVPVGQISGIPTGQLDSNEDGIGDSWAWEWHQRAGQMIEGPDDLDGDGLENLMEFRWELVPWCDSPPSILFRNCMDFESDPSDGTGGDAWTDRDEVEYWNDKENDELFTLGYALFDPDRLLDTDNDGIRNSWDPDSDNDGWVDGIEVSDVEQYYTFPEFADSDCDVAATACTSSADVSNMHEPRVGDPGSGDGINDTDEKAAWDAISPSAWNTDWDDDGILNNLLDPDSDGDGLLDGEEFLVWGTKPHAVDSDNDGLTDTQEVRTTGTDPNDWDTDGDGMPDGWEVDHNFNPLVDDGSGDSDSDGLDNLGEYTYARPGTWSEPNDGPWDGGTHPNDPDTEGDGLKDGPEALMHGTDPFWWDTDSDGLPDAWEVEYGFNPLSSDAEGDPDADFFDQGNDGTIEQTWTNLQEYRYKRATSWDETASGPWGGGTDPTTPDTDRDGAIDGQEVYFGTDATVGADPNADDDQDGLNWTEEANLGTNPSDPDTDGDGLCDGGRAAACTWPGGDGTGFQPGEADYGSTPWLTDSDGDGLSDAAEAILWDPGATGSARDVDGDFLGGVIDADNDGDGLLDGDEVSRGTDPAVTDSDGDGLSDGDEVDYYGTDPLDSDTDNDGLGDGNEVNEFSTKPLVADTDGDGLSDGAEVTQHATDPLVRDTDTDGMPDGWEVDHGTQPRVQDASLDPDNDGLVNAYEYSIGSHPTNGDTDGDGLPDGWEDRHATSVVTWSRTWNPDSDGATNIQEFEAGTDPQDPDSDGDGLIDGDELDEGTDPLARDSDLDGLTDGAEVHTHGSSPILMDTDGEGLNDYDEVQARTDPNDRDSDDDGLTDYQEVFGFGGKYDPNNPDTNDDGYTDGENAALEGCPTCDEDNDGLSNEQEVNTYGTQPFQADSDCDGAEDGPEAHYWNRRYGLATVKAYLQDADVDGDGIKDGVELGTVGTPRQVLYRTLPDAVDSENGGVGDGLRDDEEATNNVKVACGSSQMSSSSSMSGLGFGDLFLPEPGTEGNPIVGNAGTPLPEPTAVLSLVDVVKDDGLLALVPGQLYEDPSGLLYGVDAEGLFAQGGYAVRYYLNVTDDLLQDPGLDLSGLFQSQTMAGPGTNGELTDPELVDTDGDGLWDGEEVTGSKNPYKGDRWQSSLPGGNTDPTNPDTDRDGIPDGPEVGVTRSGSVLNNAWVTNPNDDDTDGDGRSDGLEDGGRDGVNDLSYNSNTGAFTPTNGATSSPIDADTDDDGIRDDVELLDRRLNPLQWDSDGDGLSDGLETGVTSPVVIDGITHTVTGKDVFGLTDWPTFQAFPTKAQNPASYGAGNTPITTEVDRRDSDGDGIIDGLEDVNHNGRFGESGEVHPLVADSDSDGRTDGEELLFYGSYTFQTFIEARGSPASGTSYDGHQFKTNPLVKSTDGDDIPDGKDIDPKGDGLLFLELDTFYQYDKIDGCCGFANHKTDLVLKITVETGVGDFWLETTKLQNFGKKDGAGFDGSGIDVDEHTNPPTFTGTVLRAIDVANDASDTIQFDLPDNIDDFVKARDMNIRVRVDAIDIDQSNHDNVDVSAVKGDTQFYDVHGFDLSAGPPGGGHEVLLDANGNGDGVKGDQNDGRLKMNVKSNLMPYFLRQMLGTQNPSGNCLGDVTEANAPCIQ